MLRWMNVLFVSTLSFATIAGSSLVSNTVLAKEMNASQEANEFLAAYEKLGWFSGSVLIIENHKIILDRSYGMANYKNHTPFTPSTEFRIGSMTKQFTAMAILQLQQKRLLNVNDKLGEFLPQYPKWKNITIQELLTHTSGIPNYTEFAPLKTLETPQSVTDILRLIYNKPLDFSAGTQFYYSNSNYVILGYLVQKLSGMSYADYLRKNIFEPLGMTHTGFITPQNAPKLATGYEITGIHGTGAVTAPPYYSYGNGGLYSTTTDLYKWNQALYTTKLTSKNNLHAMLSQETPLQNYGYGWFIGTIGSDSIQSHGGSVFGFQSYIIRDPAKNLVIIVLANSDTSPVTAIVQGLVNITLNHTQATLPTTNDTSLPLKPSDIIRFAGRYEYTPSPSAKPEIVTVSAENHQLYFSGFERYPSIHVPLYLTAMSHPLEMAIFEAKLLPLTLTFNLSRQGEAFDLMIGRLTFTRMNG